MDSKFNPVIEASQNLHRLGRDQAQVRMGSYKKYEKALENVEKELDGLAKKTEKNCAFFVKMIESFLKKTHSLTQEVESVKNEVLATSDEMVEAMMALENGLLERNKNAGKQLRVSLGDFEKRCQIIQEREDVKLTENTVQAVRMIHKCGV